ncbi:dxs_2 [Symbiodinium sp. CCMP2456]|nr:dxs_2 [Symbiodinium sp. CCMP2456]
MPPLLPKIASPRDLDGMSATQLEQVASEIRDTLCNLVEARSAHFASNLGVVELCLALHTTFDFLHDRLIWDTGHQIYPHKLITGRYDEFPSIRTKGGLMGYPNPEESDYDLFVTVVYEALNNLNRDGKRLLIVLNDNKMSICPRVGGVADYFDRLRMNPMYTGLKEEVARVLSKVPLLGDPTERMLAQIKEAAKAGLHGGMFFEELGVRYIGPIDGHNIKLLRKYLRMVKAGDGPVLLHVVTEKGHGFRPAAEDPVTFHAPPVFQRDTSDRDRVVSIKKSDGRSYTHVASDAIHAAMAKNDRVTVLTAAMCQGNKLERLRDDYPDRFFDTGICEAHTVAFAAGQAKVGMRPVVDIYSTFLQRSFDHIFQEVALQNLPVTFTLDRGGLSGPDGATHHGVFDMAYLRVFPNMVVMAPGDAGDLSPMLDFAIKHDSPCAIRYPKAAAIEIAGDRAPVELGKAEVLREGPDGAIVCGGALLVDCLAAADKLQSEQGIDLTVVNARFIKPLDTKTILPIIDRSPFVVTVEEAQLAGGFGSAVLEACSDAGVSTAHLRRLGIPDVYVEHGDREELLADLGLDSAGILKTCQELAGNRAANLAG